MITFIQYGLIASYQGVFRLLFLLAAPLLIEGIDVDKLASDFSLFSALTMIFSLAPGVYVHRIIKNKINWKYYAASMVSFGYMLTYIINGIYYYFSNSHLISYELLNLIPLVTLHMIVRNRYIYYKEELLVIVSDLVFTLLFYFLFISFCFFNADSVIFVIYFFSIAILGFVGILKQNKFIREYLNAINSGVSNFCSGGVILLLPFVMSLIDNSLTYTTMLSVSILSIVMLLPRIQLLKKTRDIVRASHRPSAYKYLSLNRIVLFRVLLVSVLVGCLVSLIWFNYQGIANLKVLLVCFGVAFYFLFSQLSLFDCNYIIYKGETFRLLKANVMLLFSYSLMSLMVWFLVRNNCIDDQFGGVLNVYCLSAIMAFRFYHILKVIKDES